MAAAASITTTAVPRPYRVDAAESGHLGRRSPQRRVLELPTHYSLTLVSYARSVCMPQGTKGALTGATGRDMSRKGQLMQLTQFSVLRPRLLAAIRMALWHSSCPSLDPSVAYVVPSPGDSDTAEPRFGRPTCTATCNHASRIPFTPTPPLFVFTSPREQVEPSRFDGRACPARAGSSSHVSLSVTAITEGLADAQTYAVSRAFQVPGDLSSCTAHVTEHLHLRRHPDFDATGNLLTSSGCRRLQSVYSNGAIHKHRHAEEALRCFRGRGAGASTARGTLCWTERGVGGEEKGVGPGSGGC